MWSHLEPHSASIESICEPLFTKAKEYDHAWSISELKLSRDDTEFLRSWFVLLTPNSKNNWIKTVYMTRYSIEALTYRQMFGALLICAGTEICREESREDSVWPVIRNILPKSHELRYELFLPNGQPSSLTKGIISEAVRGLNLRHAIDIEGTQQWFTTIKLQFGFTFRGANNRLAEWLVNIGRPHAIQYLNGDSDVPELTSKSFQSLWRAFTQYRKGLITETETRKTLSGNPWIKIHWIDDLLEEAMARIETLGRGERSLNEHQISEDEITNEFCPISNVSLDWPEGGIPRLLFSLDRQAIEEEVSGADFSELDFYIDGKKLRRWVRQRDGTWIGKEKIYAEPENVKKQPNLIPQTLIMQSPSGEKIVEWDFADSGLSDEVIVFDLDREKLVNTGVERLEPNRHYAIICDCNSELQGCESVFTYISNKLKVIRLASPLDDNLCIVYEDFILWQPVHEAEERLYYPLTLSTSVREPLPINERSALILNGLPEEATDVKLLIHRKIYDLEQNSDEWRTHKDVTLTPELAAGHRRIRVRFIYNDRTYTRKPRLALNLLGLALYRLNKNASETSFTLVKTGDHFNRSEGTTNIRIWTPLQENHTTVFEGNYQVGKLRHQKMSLRDFPGFGGQIKVLCDGIFYNLGTSCVDNGCVQRYIPAILGCDAQVFLNSDKKHEDVADDGYAIHLWVKGERKANFIRIPNNNILTTSTDRVWKINDSHNPMAIALTWKGCWLGAWWSCEAIRDFIKERKDLSEHDYAIIKWLRVPILDSTLSTAMKNIILHTPHRFINSWLNNSNLPSGIKPHNNITGLDSIVRTFLWNDFPAIHAGDTFNLITGVPGNWYLGKQCITHLQGFSEISWILFWKGLEHCLKYNTGNIIDLLNSLARCNVDLPIKASQVQLEYRINQLEKQVSKATALNNDELELTISSCIGSMINRTSLTDCQYSNLMKLSTFVSGRKYLSERITKYWFDLSRG